MTADRPPDSTIEGKQVMATLDLATVRLDRGSHGGPAAGMCFNEAVSIMAGERFSDAPACVSPVLRGYGLNLNDGWDDVQRQKLVPFIPRVLGTAGDGQDEARGYLALDWLVRTYTPAWLDLAGLNAEAAELRGLRPVTDLAAAESAGPVVRKARAKAADARAADARAADAGAAAGAAAGYAAGYAAGDAAWDAAWDAARAAAWAAAWAAVAAARAAWDAAWAAAKDALRHTVEVLQASALDLFDKMVDPSAVSRG